MEQAIESEAAGKVAQALAVAVQVAETIVRLRAQKAADREAQARQLEGAAKAERTAHYAADRVTWSRTGEPRWLLDAPVTDLGRAWGAATGWADTDSAAARAADRVEERLRTLDPDTMASYDRARSAGADRMTAMRDVFEQRTGASAASRHIFVGEPARAASSDRPDFAAARDGRTAADIAAESYPEPYTTVATRQPAPDAVTPPQQQSAAKTRGLSR